MINIKFKEGLLFTSITLIYKNQAKTIHNIVIDTGACKTIISPDVVDDIGVYAESSDKLIPLCGVGGSIHYSFEKEINEVKFGDLSIKNIKIDFGIIDNKGEINGLLGLDILRKLGIIIDLEDLTIYKK